ncbi:MAG TPA: cellulase family glycosylhydrolase [Holophagaceae bacterium]|nr:cellulase family glycosylhydrolase [Holophagaceae bacterium]
MQPLPPDEASDFSEGRRHVLLSLAGVLALSACGGGSAEGASSTPVQGAPARLRISGADILGPDGKPLTLRGWNWGRWGITQPDDAARNGSEGANCVRIPLRWWGYYDGKGIDSRDDAQTATAGIDPGHLAILDGMVEQASKAKLWIILFIDSNCGQDGTQGAPADLSMVQYCDPKGLYPNGHNFWTDPDARARFIEAWKFIAARYKDTPYLGMFEPLPEPNPASADDADITTFYGQVMTALRPVAPGIPFLLGPRLYKMTDASKAYNTAWSDVVYTGDLFVHTGGTQAQNIADLTTRLQALVDLRAANRVPVFVQQAGVQSGEDPDLAYLDALLPLLNQNGVGYTYWMYRDTLNPDAYGVIYQDGNGGWITKQPFLDAISASFKA